MGLEKLLVTPATNQATFDDVVVWADENKVGGFAAALFISVISPVAMALNTLLFLFTWDVQVLRNAGVHLFRSIFFPLMIFGSLLPPPLNAWPFLSNLVTQARAQYAAEDAERLEAERLAAPPSPADLQMEEERRRSAFRAQMFEGPRDHATNEEIIDHYRAQLDLINEEMGHSTDSSYRQELAGAHALLVRTLHVFIESGRQTAQTGVLRQQLTSVSSERDSLRNQVNVLGEALMQNRQSQVVLVGQIRVLEVTAHLIQQQLEASKAREQELQRVVGRNGAEVEALKEIVKKQSERLRKIQETLEETIDELQNARDEKDSLEKSLQLLKGQNTLLQGNLEKSKESVTILRLVGIRGAGEKAVMEQHLKEALAKCAKLEAFEEELQLITTQLESNMALVRSLSESSEECKRLCEASEAEKLKLEEELRGVKEMIEQQKRTIKVLQESNEMVQAQAVLEHRASGEEDVRSASSSASPFRSSSTPELRRGSVLVHEVEENDLGEVVLKEDEDPLRPVRTEQDIEQEDVVDDEDQALYLRFKEETEEIGQLVTNWLHRLIHVTEDGYQNRYEHATFEKEIKAKKAEVTTKLRAGGLDPREQRHQSRLLELLKKAIPD